MKPLPRGAGGLVYSTEVGRTCPTCRQAVAQCACTPPPRPAGDGTVRVGRDAKGRGGKVMTVVRGVPLDDPALAALAKQLKALCGTGGTVKDGVIEVQGDHVDKLLPVLQGRGWPVKRTGG